MTQEYLDMMMPIDYTPEAFQYVNRRSYDKWRMIGMQFSHTFVGGVTAIGEDNYMFNAGRLKGFDSGCKVIEELNQNNQIVGRGGWYFRAKRAELDVGVDVNHPEKYYDVTDLNYPSNTSAVYGIMGHCAQVDAEREITGITNPGIEEIEGMTYNEQEALDAVLEGSTEALLASQQRAQREVSRFRSRGGVTGSSLASQVSI